MSSPKKDKLPIIEPGLATRALALGAPLKPAALELHRSCVAGSLRRKARLSHSFYFAGDEGNAQLWVMSAHC